VRLIPLLASRLREDEDINVRAIAATALGHFVLMGELDEIRPDPRTQAYQSLLATCLDSEENGEVRRRALESLAYADTEAVTDLISKAYAAPEEKMRVSAVFAMGRSANTGWARQVRQELFSPNPELRYEAARACGELQLPGSVPDLADLTEDVDPEVQEAALWALGQIGGEKARKVLEHYCLAASEATRMAAQAALDELVFMHGDLTGFFNRLAEEGDW
jgi:HEAT repeat protein